MQLINISWACSAFLLLVRPCYGLLYYALFFFNSIKLEFFNVFYTFVTHYTKILKCPPIFGDASPDAFQHIKYISMSDICYFYSGDASSEHFKKYVDN